MNANTAVSAETRRIVESFYKAGDMAGRFRLMDEKIVIHEPGFLPYGDDYHGHAGFTKLFGIVTEYLEVARLVIDYFVVEGDRAIGVIRVPDKKGGEVVLAEESVVRNGKIVEMRIFFYNAGGIPLKN